MLLTLALDELRYVYIFGSVLNGRTLPADNILLLILLLLPLSLFCLFLFLFLFLFLSLFLFLFLGSCALQDIIPIVCLCPCSTQRSLLWYQFFTNGFTGFLNFSLRMLGSLSDLN